MKLGLQDEFATDLRAVQEELITNPLTWGEPRFTLPGRNVRLRQGAVGLLHVTYGVDEQARVVFVMRIRLMPNAPLADAP